MTTDELRVGQRIEVRYPHLHFPRIATVSVLPREGFKVLTVRWANGEESLVHIDQVTLRSVKA